MTAAPSSRRLAEQRADDVGRAVGSADLEAGPPRVDRDREREERAALLLSRDQPTELTHVDVVAELYAKRAAGRRRSVSSLGEHRAPVREPVRQGAVVE